MLRMIEEDKQRHPAHLDKVTDSQDCERIYRLPKLCIRLTRCMISAAMCSLLESLSICTLTVWVSTEPFMATKSN